HVLRERAKGRTNEEIASAINVARLDYPVDKLEIFLQVEEYDDETREALRKIGLCWIRPPMKRPIRE
ncbi:MAG TPA: hypothetical protein VE715_09610, partial [Blastocatellia bacterium]|nr:hypothetical protein [Blastocatellia bacterium]